MTRAGGTVRRQGSPPGTSRAARSPRRRFLPFLPGFAALRRPAAAVLVGLAAAVVFDVPSAVAQSDVTTASASREPIGPSLSRSTRLGADGVAKDSVTLSWRAPTQGSFSGVQFRLGRYPESRNGAAPGISACAGNRAFSNSESAWYDIPDSGPRGVLSFTFDSQWLGCGGVSLDTFELRAQLRAVQRVWPNPWSASEPSAEARMPNTVPRLLGMGLGSGDVSALEAGDDLVIRAIFDRPVRVTTSGGEPSIGLTIGGTARRAVFRRVVNPPRFRNYGRNVGSAIEFAYTMQASDAEASAITVTRNSLRATGGASIVSATGGSRPALSHSRFVLRDDRWNAHANSGEPLTATLESVPSSHDGETAFSVQVRFSEAIATGYEAVRDHALTVTNAEVTNASRVDGRSDLWKLDIEPDSDTDATLSVAANRECTGSGALCTADGRSLSNALEATIAGPVETTAEEQVATTGLTASFQNVPASHDGSGAISLRIGLDAALSTSWKGVRHSLAIANGTLTRIHRIGGRSDLWGIDVEPAGDGEVTVRLNPSADCADPATTMCSLGGRRVETAVSTVIPGPAPVDTTAPLTATFANVPAAHDGSGAISLRIGLDAALSTSWKGVRHSLAIANGTLTRIHRIDGRSDLWGIDVAPAGDGDVTVRLNPSADCADPATTMCASGGRRLETAVSTVIPGPAPVDTTVDTTAPLTARFVNMPSGHDSGSFAFRILFSEPLARSYSYETMRDSSVRVTQGGRTGGAAGARRVDGRNDLWEIAVDPASRADIAIGLGPTAACTDTGAMCTGGGKALSGGLQASVIGLPGLSVADARVREAANATVDFAVTLSRAAGAAVTVDYATSDGTATAGADYRATTGTLTFVSGETAKSVSVAVIEDDHDEGEETLTLTLSNASGGNAWLKDATATGAIENTDAMPQAWLARFGRTVAGQVVDAVESRFAAARQPGVAVNLAGQALPRWSAGGTDAEAQERLAALSDRLGGRRDGAAGAGYGSRALTGRDLLTGTSFSLTAQAAGGAGGLVSLWGRGAVSRFDGREGGLSLDGEVASAMLGTDWTREAWTAGLLLSHSRGEGGYRGASEGTVSSSVTGLYPYGRFMVNPRVTLWGVAGYGAGTLTLTPKTAEADRKDSPIRTGMALTMAAAGVRGVAFAAPAEGGFELAVTSDAMVVRTSSEKTAGLVAAEADVIRLRLGLEGSWRGIALGGGRLTPRLEAGGRHDGGDAETGFGLDLGGGLAWAHPVSGISADLSGRGLLTHEAGGFRDRGLSGSFAWDPGQGSGLGPKLALTQTLGASAAGGMDALLGRETPAGLAANDNGARGDDLRNRRLELKLGYGFPAFGGRFTSTPELGLGLSNGRREMSLGWRLNRVQGPAALELRLEATRREETNDNADPVHGIGFRLTAR